MTGLEKILNEIENDSKETARQIVEKANKDAQEIINETNVLIQEKKSVFEDEMQKKS